MPGASKRAVTIALFATVSSAALLSGDAEAAPPKGPCAVSKRSMSPPRCATA